MLRVLLADDEPLVLIGLQGMIEWERLGYEVCATARNGRLALEAIERERPDIVIADVRMPVMDGLALARACHEKGPLPVFIMLTSSEEFSYAKQAIEAGVVDYLVKMELTDESLCEALARAAARVKKEQALTGHMPSQPEVVEGLRGLQERFFVRLFAGRIADEEELLQEMRHLSLTRGRDALLAVGCDVRPGSATMTTEQQLKLNMACARLVENTLQNYLPCHITTDGVLRCTLLFCLNAEQEKDYQAIITPLLQKAGQIVYNYFSVRLLCAVGRPTASLVSDDRRCRENDRLSPLLSEAEPILFVEMAEGDANASRAQTVAQVQEYIREHLSDKLTLADVAAVFGFSPGYLSQLFGKYGDSGFVEYITEARVAAAKEMLAQRDRKVYEIAELLGFESSFYFSKVFKKVTGLSPREYQQSL